MCKALFWKLGTHQYTHTKVHDSHRYQKNTEEMPLHPTQEDQGRKPWKDSERWKEMAEEGLPSSEGAWSRGTGKWSHSRTLFLCMPVIYKPARLVLVARQGDQGSLMPQQDLGLPYSWRVTLKSLKPRSDVSKFPSQISQTAFICEYCLSCIRGLKIQKQTKQKTGRFFPVLIREDG